MGYSEALQGALGSKSPGTVPEAARLGQMQGKYSQKMVELWRTDGWCTYGGGYFTLVDPDAVAPILSSWPGIPAASEGFAHDALGNLFLWAKGEIRRLNIHENDLEFITANEDFFFEYEVYNPKFKLEKLSDKYFQAVRKRLGDLEPGLCFAFVPALALGGTKSVKNLQKVAWLEHLEILRQLHGG